MERNPACSEICPECGLKLIFEDGVCYCPGEYCSYKCDGCKRGLGAVLAPKEVE